MTRRLLIAALTVALLGLLAPVATALGAAAPGWQIASYGFPSSFSAADTAHCETAAVQYPECDSYEVTIRDAGSLASTEGDVISFTDALPEGVSLIEARLTWPRLAETLAEAGFEPPAGPGEEDVDNLFPIMEEEAHLGPQGGGCTVSSTPPSTIHCSVVPQHFLEFLEPKPCTGEKCSVRPDETVKLTLFVKVDEPGEPRALSNVATVEGGGAPRARAETSNAIGGPAPDYGFESFAFQASGPEGAVDRQAGDHPYELAVGAAFNTSFRFGPESSLNAENVQDARDVITDLPVGFVGSILAAPQCTFSQLSSHIRNGVGGCPKGSIVGHIKTEPVTQDSISGPVYNMAPEEGYPAEFAYADTLGGTHVFYAHVVPSPEGYRLQTINPEIPAIRLKAFEVVLYGDPAAKDETPNQQVPFFTNPSNCDGEEPTATIYTDSWQNPARFNPDGTPVDLEEGQWAKASAKAPPMVGCNILRFPAQIEAQPSSKEADAPSGVDFDIKVPQSETIGVPATPTLKKVLETFPPGFTLDPSAASGLDACSEAQIGWLGGPATHFDAHAPGCPDASKVGELELETPLIGERRLKGEMFLARQYENPVGEPGHSEGSLIGLYVVVHDPITGVLIKIAGRASLDPHTGQITGEFDENPNLPFSNLELHFFGGPRAEFATPEHCGSYTTTTSLEPWSAPDSGLPANPFDTFAIDEACPGGQFKPAFTAGSANLQAGAFTNFTVGFERSDSEDELAGLTATLPNGLSADIASVPECTNAEIQAAEAGTGGCPQATQVGTVTAGVGPGPDPFFATGKAYWTGPYNGGQFGLAVVVPAVAGPFNFGTVVVRQAIHLDPRTAQVTDVSDPFPTIIDGIPLRMRQVEVELNRHGFTFNPTNCAGQQITGTVTGSPLAAPASLNAHGVGFANVAGPSSVFSTPFQVTNCASLRFRPSFTASTAAHASRGRGASLTVRLVYPRAPQGSQSNIRYVKVQLPRAMPSELRTLQHACLARTFEEGPEKCSADSIVGHARAVTPILPVALSGNAYFVSYGGAQFPELILVLKGDGVRIDLHGETDITKGITTSTFKAVPDEPVTSFELTLPEQTYSALGANLPHEGQDFCGQKLVMPTRFIAQNGMELSQNTPIKVTGCPKAHKAKKKAKHRKKHRKAKKQSKSLTVEFKR